MKNFIKAPETFDELEETNPRPALFLAGTITGAADWQQEATSYLEIHRPDILIVNPRQDNFDVKDPTAGDKQIEWENEHLGLSDGILFWFPKEGVSAITLFELGYYIRDYGDLFVGCHPEFWRAFDVNKQLKLKRPELVVQKSLEDLLLQVVKEF